MLASACCNSAGMVLDPQASALQLLALTLGNDIIHMTQASYVHRIPCVHTCPNTLHTRARFTPATFPTLLLSTGEALPPTKHTAGNMQGSSDTVSVSRVSGLLYQCMTCWVAWCPGPSRRCWHTLRQVGKEKRPSELTHGAEQGSRHGPQAMVCSQCESPQVAARPGHYMPRGLQAPARPKHPWTTI